MLPYKRSERVAHQIQREVSEIVMNRIKAPSLGFITITDVEVSDDLKHAKIFFSVLKNEDRKPTAEALTHATPFVRGELARRMKLRSVPEIRFVYDESIGYGNHIERLIKKIHEDE